MHLGAADHSSARRAGFTLIELIVVLIMLAVLAAVAAANMPNASDRALVYDFHQLKTHIRFAQARAMGQNREFGIRVQGGSYWLFSGADTTNRVTLPNQDAATVPLRVSANPASFTIAFDGRGRPYDSHVIANGNLLGSAQNVTLTKSGESRSFNITPGTGYIP